MPKPVSAGLLVFRRAGDGVDFLLAHPGGPFWRTRDDGAWSIPKGLIDANEGALAAAKREFLEETGLQVSGAFIELAPLRQRSGKLILAWAVEADLDLSGFVSNRFELEWPRGSGRMLTVPEVDQIAYFPHALARRKILPGQVGFIDQVCRAAGRTDRPAE
jgi:predicted NUDIX family NTP pyrophosphohydrolase